MRRAFKPIAIGVFVAVVIGCTGYVLAREYSSDVAYKKACEQVGGHIVNRNGHWLCVSDDGRVIEP